MAPPISQVPLPASGSGDLLNLLDMSQPAIPSTTAQSTSGTAELMELLGGGMGGGGVSGVSLTSSVRGGGFCSSSASPFWSELLSTVLPSLARTGILSSSAALCGGVHVYKYL